MALGCSTGRDAGCEVIDMKFAGLILGILFITVACGQKGDLYLPESELGVDVSGHSAPVEKKKEQKREKREL